MAEAVVGDDVYGEDPSVNQLQELAAEITGQEAGLFVASGTMGNLAAFLAHCQRGDEAILGNQAHTFLFEAGGISALGGIHSRQVHNQPDGTLNLDEVEAAIRAADAHQPITRLISVENTHNRCGGAALDQNYTSQAAQLAHRHGLMFHIDGARIFNAAASLDVTVKDLASEADSITFCLSKGLCAPVGSLLCGTRPFIQKAHRARKMLGGGMRQAGILAAAGIVALETIAPRMREDHDRARDLAAAITKIPGIVPDPGVPASNMVYCNLAAEVPVDAAEIAKRMAKLGVRVGQVGARRFRLVTHYWIDDSAVQKTARAFADVLAGL
jgi:threonine aldolase